MNFREDKHNKEKSLNFYRLVAYILSYFFIKMEILLIMINNQEAKKPVKWITMPRTQVLGLASPLLWSI